MLHHFESSRSFILQKLKIMPKSSKVDGILSAGAHLKKKKGHFMQTKDSITNLKVSHFKNIPTRKSSFLRAHQRNLPRKWWTRLKGYH